MPVTVGLVPVAAREVGNGHRDAVMFERHRRKGADARPFGRIVDILIQRQAMLQAVDQPVVHDEVHAAVTADLAGLGLDVEDDRVLVPRHEVKEETGLDVKNITYFGNQPWPYPSGLMVGFIADYAGGEITLQDEELSSGDFYTRDNLPELPRKLSLARKMIDWWIEHPNEDILN